MDAQKVDKIKSAVRRNFEVSPVHYDEFESRYGFFKELNAKLLSTMNPTASQKILDIGCGTGASSIQLAQACPGARVYGLDNSPAMLEKARMNFPANDRLVFVEGDAAALDSCMEQSFDAIIYSASIFLIPDFRESLKQAHGLLRENGKMGLTFMDGVYSDSGANLLQESELGLELGLSLKKPVSLADLENHVKSLFKSVELSVEDFRLPRQQVQEFFSIPAMSAGLFPMLPYEKRLENISRVFQRMPGNEVLFRWILIVGSK